MRVEYRDGKLHCYDSTGSPFFEFLPDFLDEFFARLGGFAAGELPLGALTGLPDRVREAFPSGPAPTPFPADLPIHHAIAQAARRTPDAPALLCGDTRLSHRQLDEAANRLAHLVRATHAPAVGDRIALYLDRTEHLLIAVLATLKLGCAYVPVDLDSPPERTGLILDASRPALVLTDEHARPRLDTGLPVLVVDGVDTSAQPATDPGTEVTGADLAYVIYTSGTTGVPKGVAVEHRNFLNIATDIRGCLDFRATDRMLAVTTIAFDISTLEVFLPLMCGGAVVMARRDDLLEVDRLLDLVARHGVTVMQATPSLWHLVTRRLDGRTLPVRALCGGEALPAALAEQLTGAVRECWNVYGPTETAVWSTRTKITAPVGRVTIGRPLANTRCHVLDERRDPLPPGIPGELHIGGAGVARGYFGDPELTDRRFVPDPFVPGQRLYRTGDLARVLANGELEFLGRNDFQVKLRGHRIELGEIESTLAGHDGVEAALVVVGGGNTADGDDGRYLAAYYLAPAPVDETGLRDFLADRLSEYMTPTVFIHLTAFPLNANGKIDRAALPDPGEHLVSGRVPPATEMEARLHALWVDLLGHEDIGVTDDFFRFGGNSILGIRLVNRINSELGTDLKIRDLFREKTVRALAGPVAAGLGTFAFRDFVIEEGDRDALHEPFPLTNVQQAYYLGRFNNFELSDVSTHVYTEFRYRHLDPARAERAFNRVLRRHHALRTVFAEDGQRFLPEVPDYRIPVHELCEESELLALREQYSHKRYDPETYPLFDLVVSRLDGVWRLHVSFDAIIVDMSSFGILFQEWAGYYREPELALPEPAISYRDYVLRYERIRDSALFDAAEDYWRAKAEDYRIELTLPMRARPSSVDTPRFRRLSRTVPRPVWQALSARCNRYGISPTALILELYGRVLAHYSGQDQLCVNLTLFNRLPLHADVNGVIGDFTVLGLFDYRTRTELGIAAKLRAVHDELLRDIDHNLYDGIDFQRWLKLSNGLPPNKIVAPVVLTSTLGSGDSASLFELPLDEHYDGMDYSISQTSQVWLDNKAYETAQGLVAEWDYVEQLFADEVIQAMHDAYCWLIERVAELEWEADDYPRLPLPAADRAVIEAANSARRPVSEHTLFSLYEERLAEFADGTAVIDGSGEYRYDRLHRDSTRLAGALARQEVVGVLAEKGYPQVVATLGVMKSGSAYVPMNVEWPNGRIGEVLAQAGADTLLVSRAQLGRTTGELGARILVVEDLVEQAAEAELPEVHPDDVAYVIFTSGSTGKPKGVTISHRGAVNTLLAVNDEFAVTAADRVLALSELSFDLSVYDLFGVLAAGGTVVFPNQAETRNPAHWAELVQRHGVTLWNSVPQLAGLLADEGSAEQLASLRAVLMSGDWIPTGLPDKLRALNPDLTVMSLGGATEGSIWSIWYPVGVVDPDWTSIPYGFAMPNQRMYVLDARGEHCPVGVTGHIHIGGDGVALGYWRDEEQTAKRYFTHPELGRLYHTGDLGRWNAQGHIEFLGRDDFQVKLNGYRVELEEISAKIARLPGVDSAVVTVQKGEDQDHLVGYLVPEHVPARSTVDKADFLLAQHGLLTEVTPHRQLTEEAEESVYTLAKSYRRFTGEEVDLDAVRKHFAEATTRQEQRSDGGDWAEVLGQLAAVTVPGRLTPKYRYPSAGGAYPLRVFAGLADGGRYYHHPLTHELCTHPLAEQAVGAEQITLVAHWPAITPLYGDRAAELAQLEAGHALALLTGELSRRGIAHRVELPMTDLDAEHTVLCRVHLGQDGGYRPEALDLVCLTRDEEGVFSAPGLIQTSVFEQRTEAFAVLAGAPAVLVLEGEPGPGHRVSAGFLFQRLRERLHADGLGTCPLGLKPTARTVYALALGHVPAEDVTAPEVPAEVPDLAEVVNRELARVLPAYMLPRFCTVLDELPLSANGKVQLDRLPQVEIEGHYQAPATDTEWTLAEMWGRLLGRPADAVSTGESFFTIGGDSLAAMKLIRLLHQDLGFDIKLRELYRHDDIVTLARLVDQARTGDEDREEGEL
ncbi:amino acid adenylation domain-containing protein [Crossiella equi]|uniref:Phenyloxazoline synthase MbtB n=1 Tax=Crossiella equi TaxID=130796 RepID=A0ABS5APA3_9PSEU|nr:non-ribosomal peptide synthetase [Crossiella equi]MBP2478398.1 amino acid adenylation domain-containing protein [Crossiella equi]